MARGSPGEEVYTPQVQPEDPPRKIVPHMEGGPVGQAFAEAGAAANQKMQADSATWAGDQLAAFRQKAVTDLETMKQNAPAGDPGDFTPKYLAQFDKNAQQLTDVPFTQTNPVARSMVERGVGQLRDTLAQHTMEWEATQRKASQIDSIQQNLDGQLPLVRAHPELADQVGSTLNDQIQSSVSEPAAKLSMLRAMDTKLTREAALGKVDQNPGGVYQQLQMDHPTDPLLARLTDPQTRQEVQDAASHGLVKQFAGGVLDQYRNAGPQAGQQAYAAVDNLTVDRDPVRNDAFKDQVRTQISEERKSLIAENQEKYAPQVMALEQSLKAGQLDPGRRGMIWGGYRQNWLTPEQAGSMLGEDDRLNLKNAIDGSGLQLIQDAYDGKYFLDPKNADQKKDANNWFLDRVDAAKIPMGSDAYTNLGAEFAHRTGMVPEPVMDWARSTMVASKDPTAVYQAAQAVDRMRTASPRGFEYADDDHKLSSIADSVLRMTKAGMAVPEAVQTARDNYARGEDQRKLMEEQWKTARPFGKDDTNLDGVLSAQVAEDPALTKSGWLWGRNPLPHPPAMQADYQELVRSKYMHNGGNAAQAEADAARDIGTKWGITQMNGSPELVKYPPERMFRSPDGGPGLTAQDIRTDIEQHVKSGEFKDSFTHWDPDQRKMVPFTPDPTNVKLVSVPGVTDNSGGKRWGVMYQDADLTAPESLYDKNHNPLMYELPVKQQDYVAMKTKALSDAKETALKTLKDRNVAEADARKALMQDQSLGAGGYPGIH
jgi:hypothetical protein